MGLRTASASAFGVAATPQPDSANATDVTKATSGATTLRFFILFSPPNHGPQLLQFNQRLLTVKLRGNIIEPGRSQDSLRIQHLDNSALPEFEGGLRGLYSGFCLAQRTGFRNLNLLVRDLVHAVSSLQRSQQFHSSALCERRSLPPGCFRFRNRDLSLVPHRHCERHPESKL